MVFLLALRTCHFSQVSITDQCSSQQFLLPFKSTFLIWLEILTMHCDCSKADRIDIKKEEILLNIHLQQSKALIFSKLQYGEVQHQRKSCIYPVTLMCQIRAKMFYLSNVQTVYFCLFSSCPSVDETTCHVSLKSKHLCEQLARFYVYCTSS